MSWWPSSPGSGLFREPFGRYSWDEGDTTSKWYTMWFNETRGVVPGAMDTYCDVDTLDTTNYTFGWVSSHNRGVTTASTCIFYHGMSMTTFDAAWVLENTTSGIADVVIKNQVDAFASQGAKDIRFRLSYEADLPTTPSGYWSVGNGWAPALTASYNATGRTEANWGPRWITSFQYISTLIRSHTSAHWPNCASRIIFDTCWIAYVNTGQDLASYVPSADYFDLVGVDTYAGNVWADIQTDFINYASAAPFSTVSSEPASTAASPDLWFIDNPSNPVEPVSVGYQTAGLYKYNNAAHFYCYFDSNGNSLNGGGGYGVTRIMDAACKQPGKLRPLSFPEWGIVVGTRGSHYLEGPGVPYGVGANDYNFAAYMKRYVKGIEDYGVPFLGAVLWDGTDQSLLTGPDSESGSITPGARSTFSIFAGSGGGQVAPSTGPSGLGSSIIDGSCMWDAMVVPFPDQGDGTSAITVTPYAHCFPGSGAVVADAAGNPFWVAGSSGVATRPFIAPVFDPPTLAASKAVPPYSGAATSVATGNTPGVYSAGAVPTTWSLSTAGDPPGDERLGPLPNDHVVSLLYQPFDPYYHVKAVSESLQMADLPSMLGDERNGGKPLVTNNGPDKVGGAYPGMAASSGAWAPTTANWTPWSSALKDINGWNVGTGSWKTINAEVDASHLPCMWMVPYLKTGHRVHLDIAAMTLNQAISTNTARNVTIGGTTYYDTIANPANGGQVRGWAWLIHQLGNLYHILPDADPIHAYIRDVYNDNAAMLAAYYPSQVASIPNMVALGMIESPQWSALGKVDQIGFNLYIAMVAMEALRGRHAGWLTHLNYLKNNFVMWGGIPGGAGSGSAASVGSCLSFISAPTIDYFPASTPFDQTTISSGPKPIFATNANDGGPNAAAFLTCPIPTKFFDTTIVGGLPWGAAGFPATTTHAASVARMMLTLSALAMPSDGLTSSLLTSMEAAIAASGGAVWSGTTGGAAKNYQGLAIYGASSVTVTPPPPPPAMTVITTTVTPSSVVAGQSAVFTGVADQPFSSLANIQYSAAAAGAAIVWTSISAPVTGTLSADGKTVTISGIVSSTISSRTAYIRDTSAGITSAGVAYAVIAAPSMTVINVTVSPPSPAGNVAYSFVGVADLAFSAVGNVQYSNQPQGVAPVWTTPTGTVTVALSNSNKTATISGLVTVSGGARSAYMRDTGTGIASAAVAYTVSPPSTVMTQIAVTVVPPAVTAAVPYQFVGVADAPWSAQANVQWSSQVSTNPISWVSVGASAPGSSTAISPDNKTVTVSGLSSGNLNPHTAYMRDTGTGITSPGVVYAVNPASGGGGGGGGGGSGIHTWDPNNAGQWSLSNGNLRALSPNDGSQADPIFVCFMNTGIPSGVKVYYEVFVENAALLTAFQLGLADTNNYGSLGELTTGNQFQGSLGKPPPVPSHTTFFSYNATVQEENVYLQQFDTVNRPNPVFWTNPDIVGIAVDRVANTVRFSLTDSIANGFSPGPTQTPQPGGPWTGPNFPISAMGGGTLWPFVSSWFTPGPVATLNCSGPFAMAVPSGFVALDNS